MTSVLYIDMTDAGRRVSPANSFSPAAFVYVGDLSRGGRKVQLGLSTVEQCDALVDLILQARESLKEPSQPPSNMGRLD